MHFIDNATVLQVYAGEDVVTTVPLNRQENYRAMGYVVTAFNPNHPITIYVLESEGNGAEPSDDRLISSIELPPYYLVTGIIDMNVQSCNRRYLHVQISEQDAGVPITVTLIGAAPSDSAVNESNFDNSVLIGGVYRID